MTVEQARNASKAELKGFLHEANEEILLAVVENPSCEDAHAATLLDRLDLPASVIEKIAGDGRLVASESVRMRLARHPHTPKRIALAMTGQLYLMDLVQLSLLPSAPPDIRRAAEEKILHKVPHLPIGEKLTLARRGTARVAAAVLVEGHPQAVKLALDNHFLNEAQILKVLARAAIPDRVVAAIAQHSKWSHVYNVRVALVRNQQTPVNTAIGFLADLTLRDLKDLAGLEEISPDMRKCICEHIDRRVMKTSAES